jgi:hypothetical protein
MWKIKSKKRDCIITNVKNVSLNIIGPLSGTHLEGGKSSYVRKLEKRINDLEISMIWKYPIM